jgi:acetyl-CoA synthetase
MVETSSYRAAIETFAWADLWSLFGGTKERLNIAVECIDRHRGHGVAVRLRGSDGNLIELSFDELADLSSRFAHHLSSKGIGPGDAVAVMVEPSLAFYGSLFGTIKCGAAAVPLFTLFGPDAVRARLDDCGAALLIVDPDCAAIAASLPGVESLVVDSSFLQELSAYPGDYEATTSAGDVAVLQYTSGTTRQLPEAVTHHHRSIVTVVLAALFGLGLKPGDRYFCPSSPAWGHGLWHGTVAPWALGLSTGAYAGKFDTDELANALKQFGITNLAAAGTVYRMLLRDDRLRGLALAKASYTGEALDAGTLSEGRAQLGVPICGMYGTTETGVILANFPGFDDYQVRDGALGKPVPGWEVAVLDEHDLPVAPGVTGELAVRRRGEWFRSKDLGRMDADGYFWYGGRADDIIISAGWTISPVEVEAVLATHVDVFEAAVIGVPDPIRGQVVKAYIVGQRTGAELHRELQELVAERLSRHEYPRLLEFVSELPKTQSGKINRQQLRLLSDGRR